MNWSEKYHSRLIEVITANQESIENGICTLVQEFLEVIQRNNSVWILGNGGSASTAEHFETDLSLIKVKNLDRYLKVSAITTNSSLLTAVSNDVSYAEVFEVILSRKASKGDLVISISASGDSSNILRAISFAKNSGMRTFSLLGFDGGLAKKVSDVSFIIKTNPGEYGIVEDIHLSICHAVSAELRGRLVN